MILVQDKHIKFSKHNQLFHRQHHDEKGECGEGEKNAPNDKHSKHSEQQQTKIKTQKKNIEIIKSNCVSACVCVCGAPHSNNFTSFRSYVKCQNRGLRSLVMVKKPI